MRVADIMSTQVDFVTTKTKVKDVARIIFGRGINGIPVVEGKKVIGFITEGDIISKLYPTMAEYAQDPIHEGNFEEMEKKVPQIFALTADKIMNKSPILVSSDTPVLRAQSIMATKSIARIPVVDEKNNLVGMITKGDIFRAVVGDNLPLTADQEYHDWQANHYDMLIDWKKRLSNEIPDLVKLFRDRKVTDILDIGFGTGEHDFALAKAGFNVLGIESSELMFRRTKDKKETYPEAIRKRIEIKTGWYPDVLSREQRIFDAAIFMGNAFPHLTQNSKKVLLSVSRVLRSKDAVAVIQTTNLQKIIEGKKRFRDLTFSTTKHGFPSEHAFLRFHDPPKGRESMSTLTMAVFDFDGKKWKFRTLNSTQTTYLTPEIAERMLKEAGFKKVSFFGGETFGPLFKEKFDPLQSDYLNIVAER